MRLQTLSVLFAIYSSATMAEAYTGKIVIDGVVMGEGGSNVVTGDGQRASQRRSVPCFSEITVEAGVDLVVRRGQGCELNIEADSNLIPLLATDVRGELLTVSTTRSFQTQGKIRVEVTTPRLKRVEIQAASDVRLVSIDSPSLTILLLGSGEVTGDGRVDRLEVVVDGSGDINLRDLVAETVRVRISGAADAEVHAGRSLEVDIDGAGDVVYFGHPVQIEKNIRGAGNVEAAE